MIDYNQFFYAAPPRTGTTWFLKACAMAGLGEGFKAHVHVPPAEKQNRLLVTTVRHPVDFLASYYLALVGGSTGVGAVDQLMPYARRATSVRSFLTLISNVEPGIVGNIFNSYHADTALRLEDFPWCVIEFLHSVGGKDLQAIAELPPQNVRRGPPVILDNTLKQRVREAEKEYCDQFDYR